jgi:hypothetical protein
MGLPWSDDDIRLARVAELLGVVNPRLNPRPLSDLALRDLVAQRVVPVGQSRAVPQQGQVQRSRVMIFEPDWLPIQVGADGADLVSPAAVPRGEFRVRLGVRGLFFANRGVTPELAALEILRKMLDTLNADVATEFHLAFVEGQHNPATLLAVRAISDGNLSGFSESSIGGSERSSLERGLRAKGVLKSRVFVPALLGETGGPTGAVTSSLSDRTGLISLQNLSPSQNNSLRFALGDCEGGFGGGASAAIRL